MGGGGNDGTEQLRADEAARQAKIQAARDAINAQFGIAPSGAAAEAPMRSKFTTPAVAGSRVFEGEGPEGGGYYTDVAGTPESFDQAGYDAAMQAYQSGLTDVSGAKAARDALYSDIAGATTQTVTRDLDKQFARASDQNLFGLARSGLLGGSADAESGGDLQSRYGEGKIRAEQAGVAAGADLKSTDEKTRQNLLALAEAGIDTGTAASLAAGQSTAAAESAKAGTAGASIGQLFGDMGQAYLNNRQANALYPNGLPRPSTGGSFFGNLFTGKKDVGRVTA